MATCEACNTIPKVVVDDYKPAGFYNEDIGGLRCYVTGSPTSTRGIFDIYDVFGLSPQTMQGADLLAKALDALVIIPDFFKGNPINPEWFTDKSDAAQQAKDEWMKGNMNFPDYVPVLFSVAGAAKTTYPSVKSWASLGLCWGGKVTALASGDGTPFSVSGQVHPGRLAREDAEKIVIPHIVLASNGEDAEVVKQYSEILTGEGS
ncbi:hypothetical protein BP6252_02054 [Coleophoma cylindrospora]|uniref:Dienelactone hydrolase domain-containing protein n=1 Tax=Coleophoma cylindrospora TaxID=1849047 RepID=A0A3D8SEE4_9HELO|nr:hypothetical protein BP6252_02054 [Coleophoma cylindrospora]